MGGRAPGKKAVKRVAVVDDPDDETIETSAEHQSTKANAGASSARKKKPKTLKDIVGFGDLAAGGGGGGGGPGGAKPRAKKSIEAVVMLGVHQSGDKKGQLTGRALYAINCEFSENANVKVLMENGAPAEKARFISDWGKWAIYTVTAKIALSIHKAIRASTAAPITAKEVNVVLDVSKFDRLETPEFTLATSQLQFETQKDGVLPRSILVAGKFYPFKEFAKAKFPEIRYLDLVFNGGADKKAAWVLPVSAQTEATGTLAAYLVGLGAIVHEVDLDAEEDEDDDAERDDGALVDEEAEEDDDE
eukprot:scaffold78386_cov63-Phaeocystis_antarctica.AAC.2